MSLCLIARKTGLVTSLAMASLVTTFFAAPRAAFAEEPPEPSEPSEPVVTPPPGTAAAAAPAPAQVPITATCSLGEHRGIDADEARTAADLLCHELAKQGATNTAHEVRFGKLGGKTLVTIASRRGNTYDERRTMLNGMEELPVAAPRLAGAIADGRSLDETKTVDNVLQSEARRPTVQPGQMGFQMGLFGMTSAGEASGASAGVDLGLVYRAGSFAVTSRGRAGGIGSSEDKVVTASLDVGGRFYTSSADTALFLGAGLELLYLNLERSGATDIDGSGLGAFGEIGVEALRSNHVTLTASLRADAPFFMLSGHETTGYAVPLSLNAGIFFH